MTGRLPGEATLGLTMTLPVRDTAALGRSVRDLSNPRSPSYRHFLTPAQFANRFGASEAEYGAVASWARAQGLRVTTHTNRLVLEVEGSVASLEAALDVRFHAATRPDGTAFHTPDRAPSLALAVPIAGIEGLDNYVPRRVMTAVASVGTGPVFTHSDGTQSASVTAVDLRNAYLGEEAGLTGAGQNVGIIAPLNTCFAQSDISAYASFNGLKGTLPVQTGLGDPSCAAGKYPATELTMDIEMVTSMAPAAQIVEAPSFQYFADRGDVPQITSSYYWSLASSEVTALSQLAAQGQSVFISSGDNGAFTTQNPEPDGFLDTKDAQLLDASFGDMPFTVVGGTALFMDGSAYDHEEGWNHSGGGILFQVAFDSGISLPSYQARLFGGAAPRRLARLAQRPRCERGREQRAPNHHQRPGRGAEGELSGHERVVAHLGPASSRSSTRRTRPRARPRASASPTRPSTASRPTSPT